MFKNHEQKEKKHRFFLTNTQSKIGINVYTVQVLSIKFFWYLRYFLF